MLKAVGRLLALLTVPILTTLSAKNVLIFPYNPSSPNIAVYSGDPLGTSPLATWSVAPYVSSVTSNATGTKYYFATSSTAPQASVYVVDSSTGNTLKRLDFTGSLTFMGMAPDGRRLVVWAGGLHVIDTNADVELTPAIPDLGPAIANGIAFTNDGTRILFLAQLGSTSGRLYAVDLSSNTVVSTNVNFPSNVTAVSVGQNGLAYVSATGAVYEVNPSTMTLTNTITVSGTPSVLTFSADGKYAVTSNMTAQIGPGLYVFDLLTKTLGFSSNTTQSFDTFIPTTSNHVIGFSTATNTIFDIPLSSPGSMTVPTWGSVNFNGSVRGVIASDEVPARYIYVLMLGTMYRVDTVLANTSGQTTVTIPQAYRLGTGGANSTSPATSFIAYNDAQTIAVGGTPLPLIAQALDANGRPVGGATVSFTTGTATVGLGATSAITNAAGFAQTTVSVPAVAGTYTVTAQVGSSTRNYTITAGTSSGGGNNGGGTTAGLSIVSGQGQILPQFSGTYLDGYEQLVVVLRDASGNPIPNVTLNWNVRTGSGTLTQYTTVTGVDGTASNNMYASFVSGAGGVSAVAIDVSDGNNHMVTFNETIVGYVPGGGQQAGGVGASILNPVTRVITGGAGATVAGALKLQIYTNWGAPLENVALKLVSTGDAAQVPTAKCEGGYALTDATGTATCNVVFGPKTGDANVTVRFGGTYAYNDFKIHVDVGPPSQIVPLTPASISGNPGQTLSQIGIEVRDGGGNPLTEVPITWTVVTPGTMTLTNAYTRTNTGGQAFATPTLGSVPGAAQLKVTAGSGTNTVSYTFTVTTNVQLGGLTYVSGNNQTALIGTGFLNPLVVKLTSAAGAAIPNYTVNWAIASGVGSLNTPGTSTTDANGNASINVFAGSTAGPIVVTATAGSLQPVSFTLTAVPPGPVFTAQSVVNYNSKQPGVTPGGLVQITGTNLAVGITGSVVANNGLPGRWPYTLNGVAVRFGNYQAPIQSVNYVNSVQSIVVQVPFELPVGTTSVTITVNGNSATQTGVQVKAVQPGLFESVDSNGRSFAVLSRPDGSLVTTDNPAVHGEILKMYATGLGQVSPITGTNEVGLPGQTIVTQLIAGVAGGGTIITNTEYATGAIGVYIVSFQLPPETAAGLNVPVSVAAQRPDGGFENSNTSVIARVI